MNLGVLGYWGPRTAELDANLDRVARALCLGPGLKLTRLSPARDVVLVLVHPEDASAAERLSETAGSVFGYAGNVFPDAAAGRIAGSPFARPDWLEARLRRAPGSGPDHSAAHGQFGAFRLERRGASARRLTLLTDRFGIQPLYVYRCPRGGWLFSNFAEAIGASGLHSGKLDGEAVASFFSVGAASMQQCFLAGVRRLPAHARWTLDADRRQRQRTGPDGRAVARRPLSPSDLQEEVYWNMRAAVRRRTRGLRAPVKLKLSGGYDSRFLLHCLLEEKVPFEAETYWYLGRDEYDVTFAGRLHEQLGFPWKARRSPLYSIEKESELGIRGGGRVSDPGRFRMTGSFAAVSVKGLVRPESRKIFKRCRALPPSPLLRRFPAEERLRALDAAVAAFPGDDAADSERRWHSFECYGAFMWRFTDPIFARPGSYFRGTFLLPYCDETLLESLYRSYPDEPDAEAFYRGLYERYMKPLARVPMQSQWRPDSPYADYDKSMEERDRAMRLRRVQELLASNPLLRQVCPPVAPEAMDPRYLSLLYLFGLWLEVCFPEGGLSLDGLA